MELPMYIETRMRDRSDPGGDYLIRHEFRVCEIIPGKYVHSLLDPLLFDTSSEHPYVEVVALHPELMRRGVHPHDVLKSLTPGEYQLLAEVTVGVWIRELEKILSYANPRELRRHHLVAESLLKEFRAILDKGAVHVLHVGKALLRQIQLLTFNETIHHMSEVAADVLACKSRPHVYGEWVAPEILPDLVNIKEAKVFAASLPNRSTHLLRYEDRIEEAMWRATQFFEQANRDASGDDTDDD
jgi:hypothetical protein